MHTVYTYICMVTYLLKIPHMHTVYTYTCMAISLLKIQYMHTVYICMVLANPNCSTCTPYICIYIYVWFWPTLTAVHESSALRRGGRWHWAAKQLGLNIYTSNRGPASQTFTGTNTEIKATEDLLPRKLRTQTDTNATEDCSKQSRTNSTKATTEGCSPDN
jgi:hypothetical protein